MTDETTTPNTAQITVWRNLLDAFAQLSAAWEAARESEENAADNAGPGSTELPADLVTAFARAGTRSSAALTGLADVLFQQSEGERFTRVRDCQREAHKEWSSAHDQAASD